jgi:hypothetical protein
MAAACQSSNVSPSAAETVKHGHEKESLSSAMVCKIESFVTDLVRKALTDPTTWPGGQSVTPVIFGPCTPPFDADEIEKRLAKAFDTESQTDCTHSKDSIGVSEDGENHLEKDADGKLGPNFNIASLSEPVTMSQLKELFKAVLESQAHSASDGVQNRPAESEHMAKAPHDEERAPASKMEYKTVNEAYVKLFAPNCH